VVGGGAVDGGGGGALATTKVTAVSGSTLAPALRDWEITVPARYWAVDLYLVVAVRPRSARVRLALVSVRPTSVGALILAMVVGGDVDVVSRVVATVGRVSSEVGGAVD
jgi:hypothetical protein